MTGQPLICVVEDDVSVCRAIVGLIMSMSYRCLGYNSAETALESGDAETASCIVTDIHLPGMDGFGLKRTLVSRGWFTPVIMITAHQDETLERRARDAGAIGFLRKPLPINALAECLARALAS